jgi:20S proteasome alpha/beta subunit
MLTITISTPAEADVAYAMMENEYERNCPYEDAIKFAFRVMVTASGSEDGPRKRWLFSEDAWNHFWALDH